MPPVPPGSYDHAQFIRKFIVQLQNSLYPTIIPRHNSYISFHMFNKEGKVPY